MDFPPCLMTPEGCGGPWELWLCCTTWEPPLEPTAWEDGNGVLDFEETVILMHVYRWKLVGTGWRWEHPLLSLLNVKIPSTGNSDVACAILSRFLESGESYVYLQFPSICRYLNSTESKIQHGLFRVAMLSASTLAIFYPHWIQDIPWVSFAKMWITHWFTLNMNE